MTGLFKLVVLVAAVCMLVGCEEDVSPYVTAQRDELAAMGDAFREAFGEEFEVLGVERVLLRGNDKNPYCLISARPRQAGLFVVGYQYVPAPEGYAHDRLMTVEHGLFIGERDAQRHGARSQTWPLANVGDTIIIPVVMGGRVSRHRFYRGELGERPVDSRPRVSPFLRPTTLGRSGLIPRWTSPTNAATRSRSFTRAWAACGVCRTGFTMSPSARGPRRCGRGHTMFGSIARA